MPNIETRISSVWNRCPPRRTKHPITETCAMPVPVAATADPRRPKFPVNVKVACAPGVRREGGSPALQDLPASGPQPEV